MQINNGVNNGILIDGMFYELTEADMKAILGFISDVKKAQKQAATVQAAQPVDVKKPAKKAEKKVESAYAHGQIKTMASGKSVTFVYGDSGKTVNDGRVYAEFKKLGGVWDKASKCYNFKSAAQAKKAAESMDHYSAI